MPKPYPFSKLGLPSWTSNNPLWYFAPALAVTATLCGSLGGLFQVYFKIRSSYFPVSGRGLAYFELMCLPFKLSIKFPFKLRKFLLEFSKLMQGMFYRLRSCSFLFFLPISALVLPFSLSSFP